MTLRISNCEHCAARTENRQCSVCPGYCYFCAYACSWRPGQSFSDRVVTVIEDQSYPTLQTTLVAFQKRQHPRVEREWKQWLIESAE